MPNIYGNGVDLTPDIIQKYGALGYNVVTDPSKIGKGDLVIGGAGAVGGISDDMLNGATRIGGKDRNETAGMLNNYYNGLQYTNTGKMYDDLQSAKLQAAQAARNQAITGYNQSKDNAKVQYQGMRNQASVNAAQSAQRLKEVMASQGLFNSGDNVTGQVNISNQRASNINGISLQEQQYINDIDNKINNLISMGAAEDSQIIGELQLAKANALTDIYNRQQEWNYRNQQFDYQKQRDNTQDSQWNKQFDYQKEQDKFNNSLKKQQLSQTGNNNGSNNYNLSSNKGNNPVVMGWMQFQDAMNKGDYNWIIANKAGLIKSIGQEEYNKMLNTWKQIKSAIINNSSKNAGKKPYEMPY